MPPLLGRWASARLRPALEHRELGGVRELALVRQRGGGVALLVAGSSATLWRLARHELLAWGYWDGSLRVLLTRPVPLPAVPGVALSRQPSAQAGAGAGNRPPAAQPPPLAASEDSASSTLSASTAVSPSAAPAQAGSPVGGGPWLSQVARYCSLHASPLLLAAASTDGQLVATATADGSIGLWRAAARPSTVAPPRALAWAGSLLGHATPVRALCVSTELGVCASADAAGRVLTWDLARRQLLHAHELRPASRRQAAAIDAAVALAIDADTAELLVASGARLALWSVNGVLRACSPGTLAQGEAFTAAAFVGGAEWLRAALPGRPKIVTGHADGAHSPCRGAHALHSPPRASPPGLLQCHELSLPLILHLSLTPHL
ncbi:hypothetical protein T492DRAFT_344365 [Pavlovales sp. CCMP2436]|nr:hypothetical protein T492DRAFT_344365 [Pavlovales sp. CCMP2436]